MLKHLEFTARTDPGQRYEHNEDFYLLSEPFEKYGITAEAINKKGALFILTDGMGGAQAGEVASELAAGWTAAGFYEQKDSSDVPDEVLTRVISEINARLFELAASYDQYQGMGTTIVAAHVQDRFLTVCSVGDSRAYLFRKGKLLQLTEDQSEAWEIYKAGGISKEEIGQHPRSHILKKALGTEKGLGRDEIFTYKDKLKKNDLIFLCSDGLSDMLTDKEIAKVIKDSKQNLEKASDLLIKEANAKGGRDNISVLLFKTKD